MIQQRITLLVRDPGSLEAISFLIFTLKEFPLLHIAGLSCQSQEADYLWTTVTKIWFSWNFLFSLRTPTQ